MKGKIYNLLQILINLSGEKSDIDLVSKKNQLIEEIDSTRNKINELSKLMESNRYFDEAAQNLDKNTVIALKNKIKTLKNDEKLIKIELKSVLETEKFYNEKINLGKLNVEKYAELLKNISYKLVDKGINLDFYNSLLTKNSGKLDYWNNFVKKQEKELSEKNSNSECLKAYKENFEYEINKYRDRIDEINHNIENDLNYFNRELKEQDEKAIKSLNEKIVSLEKEYDNTVDSVSYLGLELIELIDDESYIYAKSKLNEIVWKTESVPYILENNYEKLESNLKIMKKEKEVLRSNISNNDYLNDSYKKLNSRLKDLHYLLEDNKKDIIEVKKLINYIDKDRCFSLAAKINDLNESEEMLANYNADLNHLIEYSVILKNTSLKYLESYRKKLNEELDEISKKITLKDGLVDESKKLKDIESIKGLSEKIDHITNRLNNKGDLYEIRDNLEMLIDSMDFDYLIEVVPHKDELVYLKVIEIIEPIRDDIIDLTGV